MPKRRRVALVIDLSYPSQHHHGVFVGAQLYAREHADWECVVQPFIGKLSKAAGASAGFDGIIARATPELMRSAARAKLPLVNIWSTTSADQMPSVLPDFAACGRLAAEHLLHRGFRKFAYHGFSRHRGSTLVWDGFEAELRKAKCKAGKLSVSAHCDENVRSWNKYTADLERWISEWKPPLGVLSIQDILCRYLANACLHAGLRIPEDVALISLGNEPLICPHPEPSLSSFDLNYEQVGYEAAALLDRLMDGKSEPPSPKFIQPGELAVRRSTDVYVVEDPLVVAALRYILEHCHADIRVEAVADYVHTTVRTLERHFRATLGCTMSEEIVRLRLERAKRLLVESDELVKKIAYQCGFNDVKHFHKMFRAAEGITPGEFRRRK